jgi:FG-GAP-like repeat
VTMKDAFGNTATGYRGTVHFTSSDGQAVLPANYAFTAADNGVHTFSVTLKTAGSESATATDTTTGSITGSSSVSVSAGAATTAQVSAPSTATAGTVFNATVTMKDAFGNTATGYRGTVHFTSSDGQAVLPANYAFTATDNGVHPFGVTLKTAGSATVTATDTATSTITGNASTTVSAGAATTLSVSVPSVVTGGTAFNATVTMKDAFGNTATGYLGTVHFTSSDGQASLPANYAFTATDAGVHTFSVTLTTSGSQSITATDTTTSTITGNASTTVSTATHFQVSAPSTATAGTSFNVTVTALSSSNATATGYTGTVHFASSDGQAVLPADYTFTTADNGVHTFSVTLKTAGSESVTATDTTTGSITGSSSVSVSAGAATTAQVSAPSTATAGTALNATVTMKDAYGNTATGYLGTVHFTSSDGQAVLPANYAFTATDNGVHTFSVTLKTAGSESVTATDTVTSTITGNASTTVSAGAATTLQVSAPSTATAGTAFNATVTMKDAFGNTVTGYLGTVQFTSSDGQAVLPANYAFTATDNGVHTFSVTLKTAGSESVTATDTTTGSITGSASVSVSAGAATTLQVSAPSTATPGTAFNATVTMKDAFGNTATGYLGTVHFTSSDGQAVLPANYAFTATDNGIHTFSVTLKTVGSQAVTATDTQSSTLTGTRSGILVQPDTTVLAATGNNSGEVVVTNANTGMKILDFRPFDTATSRYKGQMSIALGDVNGDGVPDLIVATRGARAGKVKVFDGVGIESGSVTLPTQTIFTAFPISGYSQGLTVAAADVNGDGIDDILAAGRKDSANGNAADVVAYAGGRGSFGSLIGSFHPFTSSFTGGVYVAARSTGSGNAEIAVSSSSNSSVQFWQLSGSTFGQIGSSSPFSTATFNAGAGDGQIAAVDNGGTIEFVTGHVSGGVTTLKLLDAGGNTLDTNTVGSGASFFAIDAVDLNQTGNDDVMFAPVTSAGGTTLELLNPTTDAVVGTLNSFLNLTGKVTISGL